MSITALGYMSVGSSRLDEWSEFATRWLGMEQAERSAHQRRFRMDDRAQRLIIDDSLSDGACAFGWEVTDKAALQTLAGTLEIRRRSPPARTRNPR